MATGNELLPEPADDSREGRRPQILKKLQTELLEPATLAYVTEQVKAVLAAQPAEEGGSEGLRKQLTGEIRKRDNLVGAIEEGGENLSVLLIALNGREANIRRLEGELARLETGPPPIDLEDLPGWVERQLQDLHGLLKENPEKVKAEFRRLISPCGSSRSTTNPTTPITVSRASAT